MSVQHKGTAQAFEGPGALVRAAQNGDRAAFGQLYTRYSRMVHAVALSRVSPTDAGDVVQEAFLRALRQLKTLREGEKFGAWMATIARRTAIEVRRRAARETALEIESGGASTQHDEMEARAALEAIRGLPKAYRETVMMRLVQGMSGPEIADRTGLTAASVRVNLHRGIKLLRASLERRVEEKRHGRQVA